MSSKNWKMLEQDPNPRVLRTWENKTGKRLSVIDKEKSYVVLWNRVISAGDILKKDVSLAEALNFARAYIKAHS